MTPRIPFSHAATMKFIDLHSMNLADMPVLVLHFLLLAPFCQEHELASILPEEAG